MSSSEPNVTRRIELIGPDESVLCVKLGVGGNEFAIELAPLFPSQHAWMSRTAKELASAAFQAGFAEGRRVAFEHIKDSCEN